jgi:anaerobic selenocysteine-containing dehydrogenase
VPDVLNAQLAAGGLNITFDELKARGFIKVPFRYRKFEDAGFRTPTGKIELYSTRLEQLGYSPLPYYKEPPESPISSPAVAAKYPLVLTTGARIPRFFNSEHRQLAKLRRAYRDPIAEIHPRTAKEHDIENGGWMWIETRRGRMQQRAKVTKGIDPRVIAAEHGWWFPEEAGPEHGVWRSNVNLLTDNQPPYDPAMGTYQLRALLCRVGRATPPATVRACEAAQPSQADHA